MACQATQQAQDKARAAQREAEGLLKAVSRGATSVEAAQAALAQLKARAPATKAATATLLGLAAGGGQPLSAAGAGARMRKACLLRVGHQCRCSNLRDETAGRTRSAPQGEGQEMTWFASFIYVIGRVVTPGEGFQGGPLACILRKCSG